MVDQLNRGLTYQKLTAEQQASFLSSPSPTLVRFESGDRIWKWTSPGPTLVNPNGGTISEYWIPWESMSVGSLLVLGFKEFRMRNGNRDGSVGAPQQAVRSSLAVTEQWNSMTTLLVAQFLQPVWGLVGRAAHQRAFNDPQHPRELNNVYFIGGGCQVVIPGLTLNHVKKL